MSTDIELRWRMALVATVLPILSVALATGAGAAGRFTIGVVIVASTLALTALLLRPPARRGPTRGPA